MRHVTHVLNDLGLRAELRIVHNNDKYFSAIYKRGKPQIYLTGWGANYPGAGGFIDDDLRCGAPGTAVALCTKSIDAEVQEAQQLQASGEPRVDRDRAPTCPGGRVGPIDESPLGLCLLRPGGEYPGAPRMGDPAQPPMGPVGHSP